MRVTTVDTYGRASTYDPCLHHTPNSCVLSVYHTRHELKLQCLQWKCIVHPHKYKHTKTHTNTHTHTCACMHIHIQWKLGTAGKLTPIPPQLAFNLLPAFAEHCTIAVIHIEACDGSQQLTRDTFLVSNGTHDFQDTKALS